MQWIHSNPPHNATGMEANATFFTNRRERQKSSKHFETRIILSKNRQKYIEYSLQVDLEPIYI